MSGYLGLQNRLWTSFDQYLVPDCHQNPLLVQIGTV